MEKWNLNVIIKMIGVFVNIQGLGILVYNEVLRKLISYYLLFYRSKRSQIISKIEIKFVLHAVFI